MRCVRLHIIRTVRNPVVRHTSRFVERHVMRSSAISFVPSLLNDVVIHHQKFTPDRIVQVATDDLSVTIAVALMISVFQREDEDTI
jgi:hypothetical protein